MRRLCLLMTLIATFAVPASALATAPGTNGRIAFVRSGDIWTVNPDGSGLTPVTSGPDDDSEPAWSPDGTTIAFSRLAGDASSHIWTVRPGSPATPLTSAAGLDEWAPAWAPDGVHISFARSCGTPDGSDCGAYVRDRSTLVLASTADPIGSPVHLGGRSAWSPDGARVAFDLGWDAGTVQLVNANGTGTKELPGSDWDDPEYVGVDFGPTWSPDGTRVAYSASRAGGTGITVIRTDGTGILNVIPATNGADAVLPSWSPDGRLIAYSNDRDGEVWVMRADGTDRHAITSGLPNGLSSPDWQPVPIPAPVTPIVAPVVSITPPAPSLSTGTVDPRCLRYPKLIRATTTRMAATQAALKRVKKVAAKRAAVKRLRVLAAQRASYRKALRTRC
jgi:Tol biopolymer transport system component